MSLPSVGAVLGGKYEIVRLLGEGGMGAVYEAENKLTHKRVAIKWLRSELTPGSDAAARLLREAQAASRIRHSNVVDVYDVEREGPSIFLVMELLEGETLTRALARHDLSMPERILLLLPAMRGVAAAHRQGVIHRDIKPDNIFLAREDDHAEPVPKVVDFGISKVEERGRAQPSLTRTGNTLGTPLYMSYEQLAGDRTLDGRADVYAFGVILYEALTGRVPFQAESLAKLVVKVATEVPVPPHTLCPDIPASLSHVIMRALARQRDDRTPSMDALIKELEPFATEQGFRAEPLAAATPVESRADSERPYPFMGRTQRRRRFDPPDLSPSPEPAGPPVAMPTPLRSTPARLPAQGARPRARWLALALAGGALLVFTYRALDPQTDQRASEPESSTAAANATAAQAPAAGPRSPTSPSSGATRADAPADDWSADRKVQVLVGEEPLAVPASSPPLAPPPQAAKAEARLSAAEKSSAVAAKVTAQRAKREPSAQDVDAGLHPVAKAPLAAPSPESPATVPVPAASTLPSQPTKPASAMPPSEEPRPFRVRPPRSQEF